MSTEIEKVELVIPIPIFPFTVSIDNKLVLPVDLHI